MIALTLLGCSLTPAPASSPIQVQQSQTTINAYDFHQGIVGIPGSPVPFTIVNRGSATVDLGGPSAIRITGANAGEFSVSALASTTIGPGGETTFDLTFTPAPPASSSARSATVTIVPLSGGRSTAFSITGKGIDFGVEQSGSVVSSYDFGTCTPGTSVTFTVHNQGTAEVDLAPILPTTTDFVASAPSRDPLPAGEAATFTVALEPTVFAVPLSADVTVESGDHLTVFTFQVQAKGTSGVFQMRGGGAPAPSGVMGTDTVIGLGTLSGVVPLTFYIDNIGSEALHWTHVQSGVGGSVVGLVDGWLASGGTQSFDINIDASDGRLGPGTYTYGLTFDTSDAGHPTFNLAVTFTKP